MTVTFRNPPVAPHLPASVGCMLPCPRSSAGRCQRKAMLMCRSEVAQLLEYHLSRQAAVGRRLVEVQLEPLHDAVTGQLVGYSARPNFRLTPHPAPFWFDTAARFGLLAELEIRIAEYAAEQLVTIPRPLFLQVQVSPGTSSEARFAGLMRRHAGRLRQVPAQYGAATQAA